MGITANRSTLMTMTSSGWLRSWDSGDAPHVLHCSSCILTRKRVCCTLRASKKVLKLQARRHEGRWAASSWHLPAASHQHRLAHTLRHVNALGQFNGWGGSGVSDERPCHRRSFAPSTRGGFHYYELFLGFLLASGLAALAQWRFNFIHFRSLSRKQKGEAIQVLHRAVWGNLLLAAAGGGRAGMPPRMPKRHAQQS